ncbi:MAG TPA: extracellular solute-binding protein [Gaiellaceae bacterium]|nr:extracellular solute-binding protein [Gaiellaceae bacterium]
MSERDWLEDIERRSLTRRAFVKRGIAGASVLGIGGLIAACGGDDDDGGGAAQEAGTQEAEKFTGTLTVTGLGVDLIDPIREAAEAALGFTLAFDVTDTVTARNKAVTQPQALDIFSGYFNDIDQVWPSGNMVPIPIDQIERWGELTSLYKTGKADANQDNSSCQLGDGDAPFRKMYVTEDGEPTTWADPESGEVSGDEPGFVTMVGGNFNMDSMGYNGDVIQKEPNEVNWDELLNPEWRGRVAVLNDPSIGMQDVANAAVAAGAMEFEDLGNMTQEEIDGLIQLLLELKRQNHFRAFWTTFDESVTLMQSGEVVIESMWSPAVALLQSSGHPTRYASPAGGFRGWAGGLGIMNHVTEDPSKYQAALDYINWWHQGEAGAIMMRQGYYNVVQETSREFVEPFEWDYWIDGKPAAEPIPNPFGQETEGIPVGSVRDGGAFTDRACVYSSWNSLMDEQQYQVQRWNEFLAA